MDTATLPSIPTLWKYRAIYRRADARVGQCSKLASIAVG